MTHIRRFWRWYRRPSLWARSRRHAVVWAVVGSATYLAFVPTVLWMLRDAAIYTDIELGILAVFGAFVPLGVVVGTYMAVLALLTVLRREHWIGEPVWWEPKRHAESSSNGGA